MRVLILGAVFLSSACSPVQSAWGFPPPSYSAKAIRATVVDEVTSRPLQGVIVVAVWELRTLSGRGPRMQVGEAVTDARGKFFIAGWGPKFRPPLTQFAEKAPLLLFFKHGYVPLTLHNESKKKVAELYPNYQTMPTRQLLELIAWYQGMPEEAVQESMWDGLTIQLEPFVGTADRWLELITNQILEIAEEDSKYARQYFEALSSERKYFERNVVDASKRSSLESLFSRIDRVLGR